MVSQSPSHPVARYQPLLIEGDLDELVGLFDKAPQLDDPRKGHIEGLSAFEQFVRTSQQWLTQRAAHVEHVALTQTDARAVEECILHLEQDGTAIALPVVVVGEPGTRALARIRVYHSMWPLTRSHWVRPPLLPECAGLVMPAVVQRYQTALADGDLEAVLQQFEPDASAREPSGGEYIYRGTTELRRFYAMLFSNDGGIPLAHCSVTDDGTRCAIEYNVTRWGQSDLPPQAGIAVYERGDSGLLRAARIYDDVDPPITT